MCARTCEAGCTGIDRFSSEGMRMFFITKPEESSEIQKMYGKISLVRFHPLVHGRNCPTDLTLQRGDHGFLSTLLNYLEIGSPMRALNDLDPNT